MRDGRRQALTLAGLAALAVLLVVALTGLPGFGGYQHAYGLVLQRVPVTERQATDTVTATIFDYRGFDTLGEEFILFTSVVGVALLLRAEREEDAERGRDAIENEAVRATAGAAVGPMLVIGLYVVAYAVVSPGGGFQGGVVLAAALALLYLGGSYSAYRRASPTPMVDAAEGLGAFFYVGLGLLALAQGEAFLENLLPKGTSGTLLSGGSIALLNWGVALEVAGAFVLLFHEFLEDLMVRRDR
jgi:multicomponent Na+:H+ antiporter subunit B